MIKWSVLSKSILVLLVLGSALSISLCAQHDDSSETVEVWLTTGDEVNKLQQQNDIRFTSGEGNNTTKILINENITNQTMEGFGAAMTDSSAWLLNELKTNNSTKYREVMNALFSKTEGIGISYIRLPMGASDFARYNYTYDYMPSGQIDPKLTKFSIDHDKDYIIPVLNDSKEINSQIKFMASPWSAPAWMKLPNTLNGGSLNPEYYEAYANYFVKFLQAYQDEEITISLVTVQNEPQNPTPKYPSMEMDWKNQSNFIINHLVPAFKNATRNDPNFSIKILVWDHNWDTPSYPNNVLNDTVNDTDANVSVIGSAWHGYNGQPVNQSDVYKNHPDKEIYFTEITGHYNLSENQTADSCFAGNLIWGIKNVAIGATRNYSKTVLYWNLALDPNGGPRLIEDDVRMRGVVTIDLPNETFNKTAEYYVIGHLSKFVERNASRIESTTLNNPTTLNNGELYHVAFKNQDHSIVLIVLNNDDSNPKSFDVQWHDQHFSYELQKQ
ncbi:MAG TPA: glycoside hydrolase family 30 beta sandwich domain-containing protein, partial [Methanothrix sp.]|nr:glycoside hydrolase family 30 beta sandwich domain-containing protein [Methanothrix sp.]